MDNKFTIQFLAEGAGSEYKPAEPMLECVFNAPNEKVAEEFAETVSKLYSDLQMVQQAYRPYEMVKSWKQVVN